MDPRLEAWVKEKAGPAISLQMTWRQALEQLLTAGASAEDILPLRDAIEEPANVRSLARLLAHDPHPSHSLEQLNDAVDASSEDLAAWLKSLTVLQKWLEGEGRTTTLKQAVGYVECSAAANDMQAMKLELDVMVESMLDSYGYSGEDASENCL